MSSECQHCHRKSQLWLCNPCQTSLEELLRGLAVGQELPNGRYSRSWIQCLQDAVHGDTRLGESARRSTEHSTPLPVNLAASQLLDNIHGMLQHWVVTVSGQLETLAAPGKDHA